MCPLSRVQYIPFLISEGLFMTLQKLGLRHLLIIWHHSPFLCGSSVSTHCAYTHIHTHTPLLSWLRVQGPLMAFGICMYT